MKKQEFLEELKQYLHVLEDGEQEDILQEYEQHIEMKIEKGLSEEEAIRDFGSVRELAGEILEAYHVKPDAGEAAERNMRKKLLKKWSFTSLSQTVSTMKIQGEKVGKGVLTGAAKLWIFMGKPFQMLGKVLRSWKEKLRNHQEKLMLIETSCGEGEADNSRPGGEEKVVQEAGYAFCGKEEVQKDGSKLCGEHKDLQIKKTRKRQTRKRMVFPVMIKGIKGICCGILSAVYWMGRLIWNCGVVCAAVFSAFMGLVFLYLFGMLFVLWQQGYPLGGVVIGCMGAVLCFISLAVFGGTFYRSRRAKQSHEINQLEKINEVIKPE